MRFWEWYQRVVMGLIALMLFLLVVRFYASPNLLPRVYAQYMRAAVPVYVMGGTLDVDITNTPLEVDVTNTPLDVEVSK